MEKVIPFVNIYEMFENVNKNSFGDMIGDCVICKTKQVDIFRHDGRCWRKAIQICRKRMLKAEAEAAKAEVAETEEPELS
jgi:hypothetical protein